LIGNSDEIKARLNENSARKTKAVHQRIHTLSLFFSRTGKENEKTKATTLKEQAKVVLICGVKNV
jgi:hypothetical protein